MSSLCLQASKDPSEGVRFALADIVRRRRAEWDGIRGDTVEITRLDQFEYGVKSPFHVLIAAERGEREDGETVVEGVQRSTQREFSRKLTFIPAGHCFHGWHDPRVNGGVSRVGRRRRVVLNSPVLRDPYYGCAACAQKALCQGSAR